ncbi:hypothetical protein MUP56_01320 [Patescibacteria group bacterium]|nr:hypothetical protein [Patescibacteria group bacterium]
MDPTKKFANLEYKNARSWLKSLSDIESKTAFFQMDPKVRTFRKNKLKKWKQSREVALFCEGISQRYKQSIDIAIAIEEDSDYDCIARWCDKDAVHFTPIQLKEFVPAKLNRELKLQDIISSLPAHYPDSKELTVAIYINRKVKINFNIIKIPRNLKIGELWFFGSVSQDRTKWFLYGDFLKEPFITYFHYPASS